MSMRATVLYGGLLAAAVLAVGCGSDEIAAGEASNENAIAAYVSLHPVSRVASALTTDLTMTPDGELSTPAGFFPGLRASFSTKEPDGTFGTRLIFQSDVTTANRDRIARQASSLDLEVVWLGPNDFWPDCLGESDCDLVKDSPSLP